MPELERQDELEPEFGGTSLLQEAAPAVLADRGSEGGRDDKDHELSSGEEYLEAFETLEIRASTDDEATELRLGDFSGPLDLLLHLIKQHRFDIFDLPISALTEHYLREIESLVDLDLEQASTFLVMASELLEIKSRMLLPNPRRDDEQEDPRMELTLRLLAYRRCKNLAQALEARQDVYESMAYRAPMNARDFGIREEREATSLEDVSPERFFWAADQLEARNRARYQDVSEKMAFITQRTRVPLKQRMKALWTSLRRRGRAFFHELPGGREGDDSTSLVTSFLSILELLKQRQITATQKENFAPILLTFDPETNDAEDAFLANWDQEEDYE